MQRPNGKETFVGLLHLHAMCQKVRNYGVDKKRWSSVRSYLCGDEINSVLAEEDSASVKSSEATVTQPVGEDLKDEVEIQCEEKEELEEEIPQENQNSDNVVLNKEEAATIIQSAFRVFMARRRSGRMEEMYDTESLQEVGSPSRVSLGTSVEVQTGNSVETLTVKEESVTSQHRVQQKARSQISKLKGDWDDSTVSSNISKMRIQHRLEAMTRRERALAYAFSQQLRICSKKKSTQSGTAEPNMGWSWLERWMATRHTESHLAEDHMSKQLSSVNSDRRYMVIKKSFDVGEEESCGSNEVPVVMENSTFTAQSMDDRYRAVKNRPKATRAVSRQKTMPTCQFPTQQTKVTKNDFSREPKKERKQIQMHPRSNGETKYKDVSSLGTSVPLINSSKWTPTE
ncbi:protein IQ-DOMAIN 33 isoform X2 [Macadamia integrifolia]|uniref:protein IQ-DOMAIN 33 isoform X2 n=1 Tax=Macadamia integrifolia TaxID=60698 RepID=UPI001C52DB6C|nr:protein IQ-DOMAIN 33 isoform X2 [Macadamia integrifolia]